MAGKKITQLLSGSLSNLPLSGVTAVVYSGTTFQHDLNHLRQILVDSGSHSFTGSQNIVGDVLITGNTTNIGTSKQIFNIPEEGTQIDQFKVNPFVDEQGYTITNATLGFQNYDDYIRGWTSDMWTSDFSYGSSVLHQPNKWEVYMFPSGSAHNNHNIAFNDNGDTTTTVRVVSEIINLNGDVTVSGSHYITENLVVGLDVHHEGRDSEALHVANSGSINIAHFQGDQPYYTQLNLKNINSGSNASGDIVVTADNGTEGIHFVNLGINSSTYNGGYVGYENDAYLLNVGKDLYVGTVGGVNHPAKLHLFAENSWENPQITIHTGSQVTFNTSSFTEGYMYEFSGSINLHHNLNVIGSTSGSYFTGSFIGDGSGLYNLPQQDLSNLSTTGSNSFIGDQQITGSVYIDVTDSDRNIYFSINGDTNTYIGTTMGSLTMFDGTGYIQLNAQNEDGSGNYSYLVLNANNDESLFFVGDNTFGRLNASINLSTSGSFNISTDNNTATLLLDGVSYDAHLATTGSNTFVGNQIISGSIILENGAIINDNTNYGISFGYLAANVNQGTQAVAIGSGAGNTLQGNLATAVGANAGALNQGPNSVAIGGLAATTIQGTGSIAIGTQAGAANQGDYSIALGYWAGTTNQAQNSIIINATGASLDTTTTDSLIVAPIRNVTGNSGILQYNNTTKEVSYSGDISNFVDNLATTGSNTFVGNEVVSGSLNISGSATLNNDNIVSSNTVQKIETITSSSYASITPVSGTLYIIID
jgi:hypothetical protein